ncbi:hypothetical protein HDU83_000946 [Entophlyctis luteolus]|nr:hypothetical protein HDU83_000946 [Entophlyctis luteolus]
MAQSAGASKEPLLLLDGGFATHLETRLGASLDSALWSAQKLLGPDGVSIVQQVHEDYMDAGCDIITTASYQAHIPTDAIRVPIPSEATTPKDIFPQLFTNAMIAATNARAAYLSRTNSNRKIRIAGSMGSFGAVLANGAEYTGNFGPTVTWPSLVEFHRVRITAVVATRPDLLAFETVPSVFEASAIVRALQIVASATTTPLPPAWVSFSCRSPAESCSGDSVDDCSRTLKDSPHIFAIGVNCTKPEYVESILRGMRRGLGDSRKTLICYPNKGETWDAIGKEWVGSTGVSSESAYADLAERWLDAGATIIGGCCRIGPNHLKELKSRL